MLIKTKSIQNKQFDYVRLDLISFKTYYDEDDDEDDEYIYEYMNKFDSMVSICILATYN